MKFWNKIKDFCEYGYDEWDDYESEIIGEVQTILKGEALEKQTYDKINEAERKHCLKLFEVACGFDEIDAATIMYVLCQNHMDIVVQAMAARMEELNNIVDKYQSVEGK